jgi:hypothetical protein
MVEVGLSQPKERVQIGSRLLGPRESKSTEEVASERGKGNVGRWTVRTRMKKQADTR